MLEEGMNVQKPIDPVSASPSAEDYDTDLHAWLMAQAARLKDRDASGLDWDNLAEEIESLGRSLVRELHSRITTIIEHLLKYEYGRQRDPARGWGETIITQRSELDSLLQQNPGLRAQLPTAISTSYITARKKALAGFWLHEPAFKVEYASELPAGNPYLVEEIIDATFFPTPNHQ
jgi:hypothetical protein